MGTGFITRQYTAWCKTCSYWFQTDDALNQTHAREIFHREGFRTVKGFLYCAKCIKLGFHK